ncbi:MAG: PH domain-containing protein [Saprospiraceae bacterium]|nr:PH domain-containing protein [Saprospiraceae bacterium]
MQHPFENQSMDPSSLPQIEKLSFQSIDRDYAKILYISNSIFFVILLLGIILLIMLEIGLTHWLSPTLILLWLSLYLGSLWLSSLSVRHKAFALRQRDISYKSGIFFRSWITVPFNRVQHCEIARGVLDNAFGLSVLKIYTAGGSGSDISIPGLKPDTAESLKEIIISKIEEVDEEE